MSSVKTVLCIQKSKVPWDPFFYYIICPGRSCIMFANDCIYYIYVLVITDI